MKRALAGAALCAMAALGSDRADPKAPPPPLTVEASGCEAVSWGPICELGKDAALTVWAKTSPDAQLTLTIGATRIQDAGTPVQEGVRWRAPIPPGSDSVQVTATRGREVAVWSMRLRPSTQSPEIVRAEKLRKTKAAEAEAIAAPLTSSPDLRTRAAAIGIVARIRLADRKIDEAMKGLREAGALHRAAGWPSEALRDELALAFAALTNARNFGLAREVLANAEALLPSVPDGEPRARYYAGLLALETGDYRAASPALHLTLLGAERIRADAHIASSASALVFLHQLLGREDEGMRLLDHAERLTAESTDVCTRALVWDMTGWFRLNARASLPNAREALQRALSLQREGCGWPGLAAQILTDLAVLAMREGAPERASALLAEAKAAQPEADPRTRAWWLDVQGQIALSQKAAAAALEAYDALAAHAAGAALPEAELRAGLGRARALEALGREEAGAAYHEAETLLERRALLVPAHEGRLGFFSTFEEIAQSAVAYFLDRDPAEAAAFARRALARNLSLLRWSDRVASLSAEERARWDAAIAAYGRGRAALEAEAQGDWKLAREDVARVTSARKTQAEALLRALDEAIAGLWGSGARSAERALPPPGAGELLLVLHDIPGGVAAFGVRAGSVRAVRVAARGGADAATRWASELIERFRPEIQASSQARFEAPSSLDAIDFHALPWNGAPLLTSVRVVYGVHAGAIPERAPDARTRALVVGDPRNDLVAAKDEARTVAAALGRSSIDVETFLGPDATRTAIDGALRRGRLSLFHYAGHGFFEEQSAWEARLPLAEASSLSAGDILTLPRAPDVVVLSGCETARAESSRNDSGLGLAHAFLVAGSRAVIASPRKVRDRAAATFAARLYAADGDDWIERARRASLAVRSELPSEDWAAFRTLVR